MSEDNEPIEYAHNDTQCIKLEVLHIRYVCLILANFVQI